MTSTPAVANDFSRRQTTPVNSLLIQLKGSYLPPSIYQSITEKYYSALTGGSSYDESSVDGVKSWLYNKILKIAEGIEEREVSAAAFLLDFPSLCDNIGEANAFKLLCRCYQMAEESMLSNTGSFPALQRASSLFAIQIEQFSNKNFEASPLDFSDTFINSSFRINCEQEAILHRQNQKTIRTAKIVFFIAFSVATGAWWSTSRLSSPKSSSPSALQPSTEKLPKDEVEDLVSAHTMQATSRPLETSLDRLASQLSRLSLNNSDTCKTIDLPSSQLSQHLFSWLSVTQRALLQNPSILNISHGSCEVHKGPSYPLIFNPMFSFVKPLTLNLSGDSCEVREKSPFAFSQDFLLRIISQNSLTSLLSNSILNESVGSCEAEETKVMPFSRAPLLHEKLMDAVQKITLANLFAHESFKHLPSMLLNVSAEAINVTTSGIEPPPFNSISSPQPSTSSESEEGFAWGSTIGYTLLTLLVLRILYKLGESAHHRYLLSKAKNIKKINPSTASSSSSAASSSPAVISGTSAPSSTLPIAAASSSSSSALVPPPVLLPAPLPVPLPTSPSTAESSASQLPVSPSPSLSPLPSESPAAASPVKVTAPSNATPSEPESGSSHLQSPQVITPQTGSPPLHQLTPQTAQSVSHHSPLGVTSVIPEEDEVESESSLRRKSDKTLDTHTPETQRHSLSRSVSRIGSASNAGGVTSSHYLELISAFSSLLETMGDEFNDLKVKINPIKDWDIAQVTSDQFEQLKLNSRHDEEIKYILQGYAATQSILQIIEDASTNDDHTNFYRQQFEKIYSLLKSWVSENKSGPTDSTNKMHNVKHLFRFLMQLSYILEITKIEWHKKITTPSSLLSALHLQKPKTPSQAEKQSESQIQRDLETLTEIYNGTASNSLTDFFSQFKLAASLYLQKCLKHKDLTSYDNMLKMMQKPEYKKEVVRLYLCADNDVSQARLSQRSTSAHKPSVTAASAVGASSTEGVCKRLNFSSPASQQEKKYPES